MQGKSTYQNLQHVPIFPEILIIHVGLQGSKPVKPKRQSAFQYWHIKSVKVLWTDMQDMIIPKNKPPMNGPGAGPSATSVRASM